MAATLLRVWSLKMYTVVCWDSSTRKSGGQEQRHGKQRMEYGRFKRLGLRYLRAGRGQTRSHPTRIHEGWRAGADWNIDHSGVSVAQRSGRGDNGSGEQEEARGAVSTWCGGRVERGGAVSGEELLRDAAIDRDQTE